MKTNKKLSIEKYVITEEPYYKPIKNEKKIFLAAWRAGIPVKIKGPTGCGKTRFVRHMTYHLNKLLQKEEGKDYTPFPFIRIACNRDLTADELQGMDKLDGTFQRGPVLVGVETGGMIYFDEIVETRDEVAVIIHPLTDSPEDRELYIPRLEKVYRPKKRTMIVASENPGYQSVTKQLKPSTNQRFVNLVFRYPSKSIEKEIITQEAQLNGTEIDLDAIIGFAEKTRLMKGHDLKEGASTRLLIYTAQLIKEGIDPRSACEVAIVNTILNDPQVREQSTYQALLEILDNHF